MGRVGLIIKVHSFFTHQNAPDEDFDKIVSALKEQAVYWSLASEFPSSTHRTNSL